MIPNYIGVKPLIIFWALAEKRDSQNTLTIKVLIPQQRGEYG